MTVSLSTTVQKRESSLREEHSRTRQQGLGKEGGRGEDCRREGCWRETHRLERHRCLMELLDREEISVSPRGCSHLQGGLAAGECGAIGRRMMENRRIKCWMLL